MLIIGLTLFNVTIAQVAINSDGANPNTSAMLDISSSQKGLLIPRMSSAQRDDIQNPTPGLLVYVTGTEDFWYYHTGAWHEIDVFDGMFGSSGSSQVQVEESADEDKIRFYVNGTEEMVMDGPRLNFLNSGGSVFIGEGAGSNDDKSDNESVGIGGSALSLQYSAHSNVGVGIEALQNSTSNYNTAIGYKALRDAGWGQNTAIGYSSNYDLHSSSRNNLSIGYKALEQNYEGSYLTAIGNMSLSNNENGDKNIAIGTGCLEANTDGSSNIAIGSDALKVNIVNGGNIAIGNESLRNNGDPVFGSSYNIAIGASTLHENTYGDNNLAIGRNALHDNTTGTYNIAIGYDAGTNSTVGANVSFGRSALNQTTTGSSNLAFGFEAVYSNLTASYNTGVGYKASHTNTTGDYNTAVGYNALFSNETGNHNTAIGYDCGPESSQPALTYATAIGNGTVNTASNQLRLGNTSVSSIGGYVGWSVISDGRFKNTIKRNVVGLDFIMKLNPVTYRLNIKKINEFLSTESTGQLSNESSHLIQTGFIAQEVESSAKDAGYDFSGVDVPKNKHDHYSLRYSTFVVPLVAAIQEQQKTIALQNQEIDELLRKIELFNDSK